MHIDLNHSIPLPEDERLETLFIRLANYISMFDSSWIHRIKPASPVDIEDFKKIVAPNVYLGKNNIPKEYDIFLSCIGEQDGGLLTQAISDSIISRGALNRLYWGRVNNHYPELKNSPYIPFLYNILGDTELSFNLFSKNPHLIAITYRDELYTTTNDTLEKLVFRCAFRRFYLPYASNLVKKQPREYSYYTFCINTAAGFKSAFPTIDCYLKFIRKIEQMFSIDETWFSNKDGYINDCYIGVKTDSSTVLSMRHADETLFGTISGYGMKSISDIKELLSTYSQIKFGVENSYFIF